jgi:hypothetical protein
MYDDARKSEFDASSSNFLRVINARFVNLHIAQIIHALSESMMQPAALP